VRFLYEEKHLDFLRRNYPKMSIAKLAVSFNKRFDLKKSEAQILAATKNHKILNGRKGKPLNEKPRLLDKKQHDFLVKQYPTLSRIELTAAVNMKFGTDFTADQIIGYCKRYQIKSGRTGRYVKGLSPFNKGTKGIMKGSNTSFKKGNVPANINPLGHERSCKDGYVWIKVEGKNPYTGHKTRYIQKHRHVYEQHHGVKVPKGKAVIFLDGNRRNFDPNNLEMIDRGLLAQFNKNQLSSAPDEIKPVMRTAIKLIVATARRSRKKQENTAR
jgi:hypothetical protein